MFLRNAGIYLRVYMASKPKIASSQIVSISEPGSEEIIWIHEQGRDKWLEKTA
jgi:hypothetical protein